MEHKSSDMKVPMCVKISQPGVYKIWRKGPDFLRLEKMKSGVREDVCSCNSQCSQVQIKDYHVTALDAVLKNWL